MEFLSAFLTSREQSLPLRAVSERADPLALPNKWAMGKGS